MDNREFKQGDDIVYGTHGRGKIAGIEVLKLDGKPQEFLRIKMETKARNQAAEVLIPREKARDQGVRHPLLIDDLPQFFSEMASIEEKLDLSRFNWDREEKRIQNYLSQGQKGLARAVGELHQTLRAMPVISPDVENAYKSLRSQIQVEVTQALKKHHKTVRNMINDALGGDYIKPYRKPVLPKVHESSSS